VVIKEEKEEIKVVKSKNKNNNLKNKERREPQERNIGLSCYQNANSASMILLPSSKILLTMRQPQLLRPSSEK